MTNPASVYDEESLTALELAGRTTAKVNEVVDAQNQLKSDTEKHLSEQDSTIDERLSEQDSNIENIRTVTVPEDVNKEVQKQIDNGTFDKKIEQCIGDLDERVDNLLGAVSEGSTTLDAEVLDIRVGANNKTYNTAGESVRTQLGELYENNSPSICETWNTVNTSQPNMTVTVQDGVFEVSGDLAGGTGFIGFNVFMGDTLPNLIGKSVGFVVHENNFICPLEIYMCPTIANWAQCVSLGTVQPNAKTKLLEIPDTNAFTGNLYIGVKAPTSDYSEFKKLRISVYLLNTNEGTTISGTSLFSFNHPEITMVKKSGYTRTSLGNTTVFGSSLTKSGVYDIETDTITVDIGEHSGSGIHYAGVSVNISDLKSKLKYIYIDATPNVNVLMLNRVNYNMSQVIARLSNGLNDVSSYGLENENSIYFTVGFSGRYLVETGAIKFYLICDDNFVVANHLIGYEDPKKDRYITCWGDSLTAGGGWTSRLSELTGLPVYNGGTGGENLRTIVARQGGDVMCVNNITIPADKTAVTIATHSSGIPTQFGHVATPLYQGGAHVNPVKIGDITGTLNWTGSSYQDTTGVWTFTRSEVGDEVVIDRPTAITTAYDREKNNPYLMVLFAGANGGFDSDIDELIRMHKLMIEHANAEHVIVLGYTTGPFGRTEESNREYETKMRQEFGRYFISLRDYLSKYGLEDAGLTPTTDDNAKMSVGEVPHQLLTDGVHYTDACKTVIGNMLYRKCKELNIF